MSIQNFLSRHEKDFVDIPQLWEKYQKNEANSLLIKNHKIDFEIFKDIIEELIPEPSSSTKLKREKQN